MNRYKVVWSNKSHEFIFAPSEVAAYSWASEEADKMDVEVHSVAPAVHDVTKQKLIPLRLET